MPAFLMVLPHVDVAFIVLEGALKQLCVDIIDARRLCFLACGVEIPVITQNFTNSFAACREEQTHDGDHHSLRRIRILYGILGYALQQGLTVCKRQFYA